MEYVQSKIRIIHAFRIPRSPRNTLIIDEQRSFRGLELQSLVQIRVLLRAANPETIDKSSDQRKVQGARRTSPGTGVKGSLGRDIGFGE